MKINETRALNSLLKSVSQRPFFVYFRSFQFKWQLHTQCELYKLKKHKCFAWVRTWGRRIVGIDDSTELWLPPMSVSLFSSQFYPAFTFWHLKPSPQIYSNPLAPFSFNFRFKFYKFERVLVQLFELILLFALARMFHFEVNSCPVVSF